MGICALLTHQSINNFRAYGETNRFRQGLLVGCPSINGVRCDPQLRPGFFGGYEGVLGTGSLAFLALMNAASPETVEFPDAKTELGRMIGLSEMAISDYFHTSL